MASFGRFEEIDAWKEARALTKEIYELTGTGPLSSDFALRDQLRKSSVSVMSNIAEGFERNGNTEFQRFLSIAKASCVEVRSQLFVALDVGYVDEPAFNELREQTEKVSRMIFGLIQYLRRSNRRGHRYD